MPAGSMDKIYIYVPYPVLSFGGILICLPYKVGLVATSKGPCTDPSPES